VIHPPRKPVIVSPHRLPLPPQVLVGALADQVHRDAGPPRPAAVWRRAIPLPQSFLEPWSTCTTLANAAPSRPCKAWVLDK
jgi:hypothetical protein